MECGDEVKTKGKCWTQFKFLFQSTDIRAFGFITNVLWEEDFFITQTLIKSSTKKWMKREQQSFTRSLLYFSCRPSAYSCNKNGRVRWVIHYSLSFLTCILGIYLNINEQTGLWLCSNSALEEETAALEHIFNTWVWPYPNNNITWDRSKLAKQLNHLVSLTDVRS